MKQKLSKIKNSGFTLIELLVVIAVIGLLASVVLVALNNSRISARNAKRISDIEQLQKAFNLANGSGSGLNSYGLPDTSAATLAGGGSSSGFVCISPTCTGTTYQAYAPVTSFLTPYLSQFPSDPTDTTRGLTGYFYDSDDTLPGYGGTTGPAGYTIGIGPMILYQLEPQSSPSCGPGIIWKIGALFTRCILVLN